VLKRTVKSVEDQLYVLRLGVLVSEIRQQQLPAKSIVKLLKPNRSELGDFLSKTEYQPGVAATTR
jgi:hypothetical protein